MDNLDLYSFFSIILLLVCFCLSVRLTKGTLSILEIIIDISLILCWKVNFGVVLLRYAVKTTISAVVFWLMVRFNYFNSRHRVKYVINTKAHAAIAVNNDLYHYIFIDIINERNKKRAAEHKQATGEDVAIPPVEGDTVFGLAPTKTRYSRNNYIVEILTGFHVGLSDNNILKLLACSGKCHDYAVLTTYQMVYNKFLSYGLLFLLRWETWIGLCFYAVFHFHLQLYLVMDTIVALILLIDLLNMSSIRLENHNELTKGHISRAPWLKLCQFVLLEVIVVVIVRLGQNAWWQAWANVVSLVVLLCWDLVFIRFSNALHV